VQVIDWNEPAANHEDITKSVYPWLDEVDSEQTGTTADGRVVAYDLGDDWDGLV